MQACCVIHQRVLFRDDCCTTYALASCWWCPHPCGGLPIAAQCDQWCLRRVVRIANRCCWFPVCVCVVSGTCGWIVLCTCLACVHRVPCVCVFSQRLCCVVCTRAGVCAADFKRQTHTPDCNRLYLVVCSSSTVCVVVVGFSGCHHVTIDLVSSLQHPCAAVCCCARTGPCTVAGLA
jgi:hypothetical protein